jgi:hypothetical protein
MQAPIQKISKAKELGYGSSGRLQAQDPEFKPQYFQGKIKQQQNKSVTAKESSGLAGAGRTPVHSGT